MTREQSVGALRFLRAFFRVAAPIFFFLPFSVSVSPKGVTWIMWRDDPLLSLTLFGLSLLMGTGWYVSAKRLRSQLSVDRETIPLPVRTPKENPYNIWRTMAFRKRLGLAFAVFLSFSTLGPLMTLMSASPEHFRPLQILITTVASGGFAACMILFGHRPSLLLVTLCLCLAAGKFSGEITDLLSPGPPVVTTQNPEDIADERSLVGAAGIALLSSSYAMFIILLAGEGRDRLRLETEVNIAQRIQLSLVPPSGLANSWCLVGGKTVPASEIGGDFFDYVSLSDQRVLVAAADVAGHGVGAGILSAMTKSALRMQSGHDPSPAVMLKHLNQTLVRLIDRRMFVTFACLLVDQTTRTARIATAGHPPVIVFRANHIVTYQPGDLFLLYTDGVVEAVSKRGEQFGTERLTSAVASHDHRPPENLCADILREVSRFAAGSTLRDDATVVAARMLN
jgi:hypothetical protein